MKKTTAPLFVLFTLLLLLSTFSEKSKAIQLINPINEVTAVPQNKRAHSWSYDGETGPQYWGELDPAFLTCQRGRAQSPINIEYAQIQGDVKAGNIEIDYKPAPVSLTKMEHAIQANMAMANNKMVLGGKEYKLEQFHFHTPSEHRINGQQFAMELHLVHQDENGKLAVLGVMIREGKENAIISALLEGLIKENKGLQSKLLINVQALLPKHSEAFHYHGSLTTPPCTEGVKWIVFKTPIEMSKQQIQSFRGIYPDNNRPIQPLNNRKIMVEDFFDGLSKPNSYY